MGTSLTSGQHFLFINLTSFIAIFGGLALWVGFIFLGLISMRFEKAFGKATHWQFYWLAPSGLFIYLVMQAWASLQHQNMGAIEQWIGYTLLIWSAALCLWGVMRFGRLVQNLLKEE